MMLLPVVMSLVVVLVTGMTSSEKEARIIKELLGANKYDKTARPGTGNSTDGPTMVTANMYLRNLESVDINNQEFTVDVTFRQKWLDPRLKFESPDNDYLTLPKDDLVWRPDTFFVNAKEVEMQEVPNKQVYVRVYSDGSVLYSMRLKLKIHCWMNLREYPFDSQECKIKIASYSQHISKLQYEWKSVTPVQKMPAMSVPNMEVSTHSTSYCNVMTSTGTYSCLSLDLTLTRHSSYQVLTIYIPYTMVILVSYSVFWLQQTDSLARLGISLSSLLTVSAKSALINLSLPPMSYTRVVDIWTGVCTMFVFLVFTTCVVSNWLGPGDKTKSAGGKDIRNRWSEATGSQKLDYVARLLYPLCFIVFNIFYWSSL